MKARKIYLKRKLKRIIDLNHGLVKQGNQMDRETFDNRFEKYYCEEGRHGIETDKVAARPWRAYITTGRQRLFWIPAFAGMTDSAGKWGLIIFIIKCHNVKVWGSPNGDLEFHSVGDNYPILENNLR